MRFWNFIFGIFRRQKAYSELKDKTNLRLHAKDALRKKNIFLEKKKENIENCGNRLVYYPRFAVLQNAGVNAMLFKNSAHSTAPTFSMFLFVGIHPSVDLYSIFFFDSMQVSLLTIHPFPKEWKNAYKVVSATKIKNCPLCVWAVEALKASRKLWKQVFDALYVLLSFTSIGSSAMRMSFDSFQDPRAFDSQTCFQRAN